MREFVPEQRIQPGENIFFENELTKQLKISGLQFDGGLCELCNQFNKVAQLSNATEKHS